MAPIRIYFELLNLIPMPWQVSAFLFISALIIYWTFLLLRFLISALSTVGMKLTELLTRLFLLPEFILTSLFHFLHLRNVPGADLYDDVVQGIFGAIYKFFERIVKIRDIEYSFPKGWVFLVALIPIVAWFMRAIPDLRGTLTEEYINRGFELYAAMQQGIVSR